ncbi:hypothetical protein N7462_010348 [Penicillium macrosclerotiorum]|uniref:uncharacterized protein n=1 Tax=Penicillium macrosclerotiorum TaxID=303699 RepID=UPI002548EF63|nr:uncharacterized protein N7462_010348 [Penicillium macrosclerotiorum]KAJ5669278.1 hypothetical protein N7462_010348 [Penicillium macrosclerotiorum]
MSSLSTPLSQREGACAFPDRTSFSTKDTIEYIWRELGLPPDALQSINLPGQDGLGLPSSFRIGHLAQSSIGLSALLAAQIYALRNDIPVPRVMVPLQHAVIEFKSERLYRYPTSPPPSPWGPIGGLHKSADGYVRMHDSFPNHREGAKALLGCPSDADRAQVAAMIATWRSVDLESAAFDAQVVISALRSYAEWDTLPQAAAIANVPILLRKIGDRPPRLPQGMDSAKPDKCLRGLRVLELSRVIAAPLSGKTLAAHGADVLWVTSPGLPDLPAIDREFCRGKRSIQVDLSAEKGQAELSKLLDEAHVFVQGFRPGSLGSRGLSPIELARRFQHRGIICANMSAYGPDGPWSDRRGFDSLVQTCSGMSVSEAEHFGTGEAARPTPCQVLDHASGYFLAAGIMAAIYKQATEGGSWQVDVSLAGTMKYLRSLGQYEGTTGFQAPDYESPNDVPEEYLETRQTGFGEMTAVRHSASIEGVTVGWDFMPKPLGSDEKKWLDI